MKRIQYDQYGGPELMRLEDFELPASGKGDVAVKVKFAAINPIDWKVRNGYLKMVCSPRADILDGLARAAKEGKYRLPVAEIVPLNEATRLIAALESGRKLNGKGLVAME